jgi:hypothetical protein
MGKQAMRGSLPMLRPPGEKPPCQWCPKIPQGDAPVPTSAVNLSRKNRAAYLHFKECDAIREFPEDPIVRRNAAIIRQIESEAEKAKTLSDQIFAMSTLWGKK